MNWLRIIIATIVIVIFSFIFGMITCGWLFKWVYEIPPIVIMDLDEMMIPVNFIGSNIAGLLRALIFSFIYALLFAGLSGKGIIKGILYGIIVFAVGAFIGIASMIFYMKISSVLVIYWTIQALILNVLCGIIVGLIYKPKE